MRNVLCTCQFMRLYKCFDDGTRRLPPVSQCIVATQRTNDVDSYSMVRPTASHNYRLHAFSSFVVWIIHDRVASYCTKNGEGVSFNSATLLTCILHAPVAGSVTCWQSA